MLWVRGPQVSGEYLGSETALDPLGWFNTRDKAHLDPDGYLFIEGRHDDTIIRGGENIAPAEIEEVLLTHPGVLEAAVAGIADPQWGQRIVAAVVLRSGHHPSTEELRSFVRGVVRSARTPDCIALWPQLPYTSTGKLLRRQVAEAFRSTDAAVETEETQGP